MPISIEKTDLGLNACISTNKCLAKRIAPFSPCIANICIETENNIREQAIPSEGREA